MKTAFAFLTFFIVISTGCKKESNTKYCWQVVDNLGNDLTAICDKTEAELVDCIRNNTCGIYNNSHVTNCNYYKLGGDKFCWKINNSYFRDLTENRAAFIARCFYGNATAIKTDCSFTCSPWYNRYKNTYKPANSVTYSQVRLQQYCGDTLATLYQGRQIIIKDDVDSLIVIQFSNNGVNW
jgi:hypothetical protein